MATYLGTSAVFEVRSGATAGNLGGGGFNPLNANFISNWTATNANTASPVLSSASYSFVAGDVGAWVYVKSGTNWTPGWYQIASVGGGNATLSAAIGAAIQVSNNRYQLSTVAGCATVASPTAGTVGIDYSQQNAAQFTATDLTGTTTTCTSATNPFGPQHAGNFLCLASGTGVTAGWYEIVSVSGITATIDRTAGTTYSAVTYYLGGAVSLGGSTTGITDAIFFALGSNATTSGSRTFIKGPATYNISGAITTLNGNAAWPAMFTGYNLQRSDSPSIASGNQPTLNMSTNIFTSASNVYLSFITLLGTASPLCSLGLSNNYRSCKVINSSSTATRAAINDQGGGAYLIGCEIVSYLGTAVLGATNGEPTSVFGCYIHDSSIGVSLESFSTAINNLFVSCTTEAINNTQGVAIIIGNTFYGTENKSGIGIVVAGPNSNSINNIFYGLVSGYGGTATSYGGYSDYNCFFNNTNNIAAALTGAVSGANDTTATNPAFTSISQVTGTTATSATNVLTDSGKNFTTAGVVAGRDYLHVTSGTGATIAIYGITAVGTTTLTTDNAIGTSSGGNLNYYITINRNLLPTGLI